MKRKSYAAAFKARVAVEAIRGEQTISQIGARFEVHSSQGSLWKKQALQHLMDAFSTRRGKAKQQEMTYLRMNCMAKSGASRWNWTG